MDFKSGFVSLVGRPNVGKSTLMNYLIDEKIAITSKKPQTTRNKIQSILTTDDCQIIFIDTPGIHEPKSKLGNYMVKTAENTFTDVDIVLFLVEPREFIKDIDINIIEKFKKTNATVFLLINKIDTIKKDVLLDIINKYSLAYNFKEIIPISATKGENIENLLETIKKYLKVGPMYFPKDMITDQPERQIVSEIIREKALYLLQEEIPHGVAIEINSMKFLKNKNVMNIEATIFCEKDSHKKIIIGKNGEMLKNIGIISRTNIERFLDANVYLNLWVKVKKNWRDNDFLLRNFGYDIKG